MTKLYVHSNETMEAMHTPAAVPREYTTYKVTHETSRKAPSDASVAGIGKSGSSVRRYHVLHAPPLHTIHTLHHTHITPYNDIFNIK